MSNLTPPTHSISGHHAVAIPFPGRGHINPMLHFCSLLLNRLSLHITIIVTQEWLDLITSDNNPTITKQQNITFLTIPNVIPSEHVRGYDHPGFVESVLRDMPAPVEQVLNSLYQATHQPPPDIIIADTFLTWAVNLGSNHGIPVASFWPMCGSVLSILLHRDLILNNSRFSQLNLSDHRRCEEEITFIPGINSVKLKEVPDMLITGMERTRRVVIEAVEECLPKAQFLILRTMEELEESAIAALRAAVSGVTVYPIGPAIPYCKHENETVEMSNELPEYLAWLNGQAERSVLYVSLGSFVAVSKEQIDELADGLKGSGERVLWVARDEAERLGSEFGERGMVVKWCDQMRVLLNPAVGGFLTHCGWNSTLESVFAGVPVLAWPLKADQPMDCKIMVDDWGIGWRLNKGGDGIVKKSEVCDAVKRFMDLGSEERRIVDENSRKLKEKVRDAVGEDGSTSSVQAFLETVFK